MTSTDTYQDFTDLAMATALIDQARALHAHVDYRRFTDDGMPAMIERAKLAGLAAMASEFLGADADVWAEWAVANAGSGTPELIRACLDDQLENIEWARTHG